MLFPYADSNQFEIPFLARHDCNIISMAVPLTVTYHFLCRFKSAFIYQASSHCWQDMIVTLLARQYHWLLHATSYAGSNQLNLQPSHFRQDMIVTLLAWQCHWLLHALSYAGSIYQASLLARDDRNIISMTVPLTVTYRFLCIKSAWSTSPHMIVTLLVWQCHWHAVFYAGQITLTSLAP